MFFNQKAIFGVFPKRKKKTDQWCRRRRCKRTPKTFYLVKVSAKSLKIREKSVEIWAKCVNTFAKSLYVLWFCYDESVDFFGGHVFILFFSGKLGKFGQVGEIFLHKVLWFEKTRLTWKEMQSFFCSGKFEKIWEKIFRNTPNLPAPTPTRQTLRPTLNEQNRMQEKKRLLHF